MNGFGGFDPNQAQMFLKEAREERRASIELSSTSFTDIAKMAGLPSSHPSFDVDKNGNRIYEILKLDKDKSPVLDKDGNPAMVPVEVRIQDIGNEGTWNKFLLSKGYAKINKDGKVEPSKDLVSLTGWMQRLAQEYDHYLEHVHLQTEKDRKTGEILVKSKPTRYNSLDAEGKIWRYRGCELTAKFYITRYKLDGYKRGLPTFVDDRAAYFYALIRTFRDMMSEFARLAHHCIDEPEKASQFIDEFFAKHYQQLKLTPFPQKDQILKLLEDEYRWQKENEENEGDIA